MTWWGKQELPWNDGENVNTTLNADKNVKRYEIIKIKLWK